MAEPRLSYSDKLRDPRWQKKRLEILQRDSFTCRYCDAQDKELHVHHLQYKKGKQPWEYEDSNFLTLCEHCHDRLTNLLKEVGLSMSNLWFFYCIEHLHTTFWGIGPESASDFLSLLSAIRWNPELVQLLTPVANKYNLVALKASQCEAQQKEANG